MRRNPIGLVWGAGLLLAVLLSVFGPGLFAALFGIDLLAVFNRLADELADWLRLLGDPARAMIRGFAIAAFVVFIALCVLARRRRLPSMGIAIGVTVLFVFLAGAPGDWAGSLHGAHWMLALLLNLGAALVMTRRLS